MVVILGAAVCPAGAADLEWGFESDTGGWTAADGTTSRTDTNASEGSYALALKGRFPGAATLVHPVSLEIDHEATFSYQVFAPKTAGTSLRTLLFLKSKDGLWYQCTRRTPLYPGRWSTVTFDLSPQSTAVRPVGHFRRWSSSAAAEMDQIGIKLFSDRAFEDEPLVDAIHLRASQPRRLEPEPLAVRNLRANRSQVPRYEKFELAFHLSRAYANPFDPDLIQVDAEIRAPSGRTHQVAAFYYQDFVRVDRAVRHGSGRVLEDFIPLGSGIWKLRFAPMELGEHTYTLAVLDRTGVRPETLTSRPRRFTCLPSRRPGYVRVAEDRVHFEFDNGDPFYPIGHNVHSSNDVSKRNCKLLGIEPRDDRGTEAYREIFAKMGRHHQNLAEIWMASWSLDIEWTARWKHYFGLGRYNMYNAYKLDRILEHAKRNGIYLHLVLENHGKLSSFVDAEWADNPYNEDNGGILANTKHFFSRTDAREQYKKKLRYIVARWGYSTQIMAYELWSEVDLTGNTWRDHNERDFLIDKVTWHDHIARYLKTIDLDRHLITTHYSGSFARVQGPLVSLDSLDYIALDAYRNRGGIIELLARTSTALARYNKPILVTEFGGSPMGSELSRMEADLHAGIWAGYMMPMAGTPMLWWFMYIDEEDQYGHFLALAKYAAGEDRRGRNLRTVTPSVSSTAPDGAARWVSAIALQNDRSAYAWVYDRRSALQVPTDPVTMEDITLTLGGFEPGSYQVEFWDTTTGEMLNRRTTVIEGSGLLSARVPSFQNDIALKVKPTGGPS